jgi:hypothetical protein
MLDFLKTYQIPKNDLTPVYFPLLVQIGIEKNWNRTGSRTVVAQRNMRQVRGFGLDRSIKTMEKGLDVDA